MSTKEIEDAFLNGDGPATTGFDALPPLDFNQLQLMASQFVPRDRVMTFVNPSFIDDLKTYKSYEQQVKEDTARATGIPRRFLRAPRKPHPNKLIQRWRVGAAKGWRKAHEKHYCEDMPTREPRPNQEFIGFDRARQDFVDSTYYAMWTNINA